MRVSWENIQSNGCQDVQVLAAAEQRLQDAGSKQLAAARLAISHGHALRQGRLALAERLAQDIVASAGPVQSLNEDIR